MNTQQDLGLGNYLDSYCKHAFHSIIDSAVYIKEKTIGQMSFVTELKLVMLSNNNGHS